MSRHVMEYITPPAPKPHYEVERWTADITGEGETYWEPLNFVATGRVATFDTRSQARREAKKYSRDHDRKTRVVKVTG